MHVDPLQSPEDPRRDPGGFLHVLAHGADDGHVGRHPDLAELRQIAADRLQLLRGIDGQGDVDLGSGHHVHHRFVSLEHLEDPAQEAVREQHLGGQDVDDGDAPLAGNGLDGTGGGDGGRGNEGPRLVDLPGVAHMHGDVPVDGRRQRAGMEHLGPEVGQLGCFREGDGANLVDVRNDPGVRGENTRNIGPDLDVLGIQRGSDQGGRVIGPSPPDGGRDPVDRGADEARRDDHFSRPQPGQELFPDAIPGELLQDGSLGEVVVGSDQIS